MSALFKPYLDAPDRFALWARFIGGQKLRRLAEVGVYRGDFAAAVLSVVHDVDAYIMIDPWRYIPTWNKPANTDDATFERYLQEAMVATRFARNKRTVLRGTTREVAGAIKDDDLDFVYIDGDHTLKGITIDLTIMLAKVRDGGWVVGDDFCDSIWQHPVQYEPTMVFPFAVYFAEAHGLPIYGLPHNQFAIQKVASGFEFLDLTNSYGDVSVRRQIAAGPGS